MTADTESPSVARRISDIVVVAVGMACVAGAVAALVSWFRRVVLHDVLRTFMSPELVWLSPVGHALLFLPFVLLLIVAAVLFARMPALRVATFVFGFLGALSILLLYNPQLHQYAALLLAVGAAVRLASAVGGKPAVWRRRFQRLAWSGTTLVSVCAALLVGGRVWSERRAVGALPQAVAGAPNILLIILDTVRARSLSLYGYVNATTPFLESLAREGTTFEWAFSTASWTLPSHASMFTGRFPSEHGADFRTALDSRYPVLSEVLAARGYRTGGFTANLTATTRGFGLHRGFSRYEDFRLTIRQLLFSTTLGQSNSLRHAGDALFEQRWIGGAVRAFLPPQLESMNVSPDNDPKTAEMVVSSYLQWRRQDTQRPYFAFLNFFDAHAPYVSPPAYDAMFSHGSVVGKYDRSIRYIDDQLRVLFDTLRARGELDNTIVVISADHGEQLGERGMQGHANSLYEQVVHVPLLVRYPARVPAGVRIGKQVTLRDLAATITDLGAVQGSTGLGGSTLARAWGPDANSISEPLQELGRAVRPGRTHRNAKGSMYALSGDSLHVIRNGDGTFEIFDYRRDPAEENNLANGPVRARLPAFEAARVRILRDSGSK